MSFHRWYTVANADKSYGLASLTQEEKRKHTPEIACSFYTSIKVWFGWKLLTPGADIQMFQEGVLKRILKGQELLLKELGYTKDQVDAFKNEAKRRAQLSPEGPFRFDWPKDAKQLLLLLGYELQPDEFCGWEPPKIY